MTVLLRVLNMILSVEDAIANLPCIIIIFVGFWGPCTNWWRCRRADNRQFKGRFSSRWRKRHFLNQLLDDGVGSFVSLWCRSRVVADRTYWAFKAKIVWRFAVSFRFRRGRRGGWRGDRWRSNWWGIGCIQRGRGLPRSISSSLGLLGFARRHGLRNVAVSRRYSWGSIWLGWSVSNFDLHPIFFLWVFSMLGHFFFGCLFAREETSLGILPKLSVTLGRGSKLVYVTISDPDFRDSGFLNYSCRGRGSHDSTAWSQRFPESSEVPLWPFGHPAS